TTNSAFNQLNVGDKLEETFTVSSVDGTTSTIKVIINGTNDAATVSSATVAVDETDTAISTSGTLTSTDIDNPDNTFTPDTITGNNGDLTIDAHGHWTFTANNAFNQLNVGDKVEETFTVTSVDGTPSTIKVTINGTNDAATVSTATVAVDETDTAISTSGTLTSTDVDNPDNTFTPDTITGNNGDLTIDAHGHWTFTANNAFNQLNVGDKVEETFTVASVDGTPSTIKVTINGTNDNATVSTVTVAVDETDAAISTSGTLTSTDIDNPDNTFTPDSLTGNNGDLTIDAHGHWTFTANNAFNHLNVGDKVEETFTVTSIDGTPSTIKVTINGTNDAATVSTATVAVDETDTAISTSGTLNSTDVDNPDNTFIPDSITGINGDLTIDAHGHWNFTANSAFNQLNVGDKVEETFTVASVDGTPSTIKVTINGTNDAATVSAAIVAVDETDTAISTSGTLTSTDVDNIDNAFTPSTISGTNGDFTIDASGQWTFTANNAFNSLNVGGKVTETFNVISVDGTPSAVTVTINGTNDSATVSSASVAVDETDSAITTSGTLTSTDVDNTDNAFTPSTVTGSNGDFTIDASGQWTFTANSAFNSLNVGDKITETFNVASVDGTPSTVTVTINGTNDIPTISGADTGALKEDVSANPQSHELTATGKLDIVDLDTGESSFVSHGFNKTALQGQYGHLQISPDGSWGYFADNSQTAIQTLGKDEHLTDTIQVTSKDGTTHDIVITINGTNDAPIITPVATQAVTEDGSKTITFHATDVDTTDALTPSVSATHGTAVLNAQGQIVFTPDANYNGPATVVLSVTDGHTTTSQTINVDVTPTNDAPVITPISPISATEDGSVVIGKIASTDIDTGDTASFKTTFTQGGFTLNTDGSYKLDPTDASFQHLKAGEIETLTIPVTVTDSGGATDTKDLVITITGTNDAPTISGIDTGTLKEDVGVNPQSYELTATGKLDIVDIDTDESSFVGHGFNKTALQGHYGHIQISPDGSWSYFADNSQTAIQTLGKNEHLTDTIQVTSKDGTTHDIVITINGTNDGPTVSHTVSLPSGNEDQSINITVQQLLANATDIDSNDLGQLSVGNLQVDHGSISQNTDGSFTFTPTPNYNGPVHFNYDVKDAHGGVTHTGASLDLAAVDDAAIITGQSTGDVDEGYGTFGDRSPDYAQTGMAKIGQDVLTADGKLDIVDPDTGESEFDPKGRGWNNSYHGQYGHLLLNTDGTWHYIVPVGSVDWVNNRKTTIGTTIDKLGEGQTLTDTITIQSKDGTTHDIVITIHGDNDKPYCSSEVQLNSGKEDTAQVLTLNQLLQNTVDVDANDAGQLTIANLHADHGSILDNKDGTFTFTPAKDYNGDVHFNYDVKDTHGGVTHTGANMTLASQQDAATFSGVDTGNITEDKHVGHSSAQTIAVSGSLTVTDPDARQDHIDYSPLGEQAIHDPFHGSLHITPQGNWGYSVKNSALQYLHEGDVENVVYRVYSADGTSHDITITVTGTNDAPVLAAQTQSVIEDGSALQGQMQATDVDYNSNPILSYEIANPVDGLTFNADGSYTFDPTHASYQHLGAGQEQTITIPVTVKDEANATSTQNLTITVHGTNDAAVISGGDIGTLKEDAGVDAQQYLNAQGQLTVVDTDTGESEFESHGWNQTAVHGLYGNLTIDKTGDWTYFTKNSNPTIQSLGEGEKLTDTLQVTSKDGTTHDIVITINGTNDAPVITPVATQTVSEDGSKTITFHATDVDTTDTLTPSVSATHGTAALNAQGDIVFTPEANYNGPATVVLSVTDGHTTTSQTINVDVTPANDAPVITPIPPISATEDGSVVTGKIASTDIDTGDTASFKTTFTQGGFTLNTDGSYKLDPTDASFQHLKAGEIETLTIPVTVTDSAGATDTKDLVITITGTNDIPIITGVNTGNITEDVNVHGMQHVLAFDGQLRITDPDTGESKFDPNVVKDATGTHVGYSSSLGGSLVIDPDTGDYSYRIDNANPKVQELQAGESIVDHITVRSVDGTSHEIAITIHGTNDAAVISGTDSGAVTEDLNSAHSVAGTLSITDVDTDEAHFSNTDILGSFGTLHLIKSGAWVYDLDNNNPAVQALGKGATVTDTITVTSADGTTHQVTITVNGTNDSALISGVDTGTLTEDITTSNNNLITSGHLTVSDSDTDEAIFQVSGTGNGAQGIRERGSLVVSDTGLGSYRIHANGDWDYTVNNQNPKIQSLATNEVLQDTITIHSADGTAHSITINIHGANDDPVLSVTQTSPTTGTLTETDVDVKDTHSFSVVSPTGQFGDLSVDPTSGAYVYTPNASVSGMSYNSATHTYHGADVFEVKVADNHGGESSRFLTFDTNGQVTATTGQPPSISATVPKNPIITTAQPSLPAGTNTPPSNAVTVDLATSSDSGTSDTDNLTNNNTPTITGQTDIPYSQVTIYDGSTPIGHAVSDASGQYSAAVSNLTDGDHNLSAKALAPSSSLPATSSLLPVHVDTAIAPLTITLTNDTGSNAADLITSDGALTISGQETGAIIEYSSDNGQTWTSSFTPQPGSNTVGVRQTDTAGNISATTSLTFTLDDQIAAPSVDLTSATDSGASNTDDLTNVHTPVITGSAEANSAISITDETGKVIGTGTTNSNGVYQITTSDMVEGNHTLTVTSTDTAGNQSQSSLPIEVDYTAPVIHNVNLSNVATHQPTFQGTVSLDTTQVDIVIQQGGQTIETLHATLDGKGGYSVDATNIPDGDYIAYIQATDEAGNTTPSMQNGKFDRFSVISPVGASISGQDTGDVTEDVHPVGGDLQTDGQLLITDPNVGEDKFVSSSVVGQTGNIGTLSITESGHWTYQVDNGNSNIQQLGAGETRNEVFTVTSVDGTTHQITVTITGTNDAPTINSGHEIWAAYDIDSAQGSGKGPDPGWYMGRDVTDIDLLPGEHLHWKIIDQSHVDHGSVEVRGGQLWYHLDRNNPAVVALNKNEYGFTDTFSVEITDEHGGSTVQQLSVRIYGGDDAGPQTTTVAVDQITSDNVINAQESGGPVDITGRVFGQFVAGDEVSVLINGTERTGTVEANGHFTISFPGPDMVNGNHNHMVGTEVMHVTLHHLVDGTDHSKDVTGEHTYYIDTEAPFPIISVDNVTSDNIINAAESGSMVDVTGTVTGDYNTGDTLTLEVDGHTHTAQVNADGSFSIPVPGAELQGAQQLSVEITTTDLAGNTVTPTPTVKHYDVDIDKPNLTIGLTDITGDNSLDLGEQNLTEASHQLEISGHVSGEFHNGDVITLNLMRPDGTAYTGTVDASGQFAIPVAGSDLVANQGHHIVATVESTDAAGNVGRSSHTLNYNLDSSTSSPTAGKPINQEVYLSIDRHSDTGAADYVTSDSTPLLHGFTTVPMSKVTIFNEQGNAIGTGTSDSNGDFTILVSSLSDGPHQLTAEAVAPNNGGLASSKPMSIEIDTQIQAPVAKLSPKSDSGVSDSDRITNDHSPIITGHAEANAHIVIRDDNGQPLGFGRANGLGEYHIQLSSLNEGHHDLVIEATDLAGNKNHSTLSVEADYTAPVIHSVNLSNVTTHQPTFQGTVSPDTTQVDIVIQQGGQTIETLHATLDGKGGYSVDATNIPDGDYIAYIQATDKAGNTTPSMLNGKFDRFSVDTHAQAPSITFESTGADSIYNAAEVASGAANTVTASIHLPSDAEAGHTLMVDGVAHIITDSEESAGKVNVEVLPGSTLSASIIDSEGNQSTLTSQIAPTADLSTARLTLSLTHDTGNSASDLTTNDGALTISGQEAGAIVEYSTDNGTHWSQSFTAAQGANTVTVRQTDSAGNVSPSSSLSFTLDNQVTAPSVSLRSDTSGQFHPTADLITQDARLSIQTEAGAQVEYSNDGGQSWGSMFNPIEGVNNLLVRQTDIAGNQSATTHFSFTLDTTPGTVSVNPISTDNALNAVENNQALVITGTTSNIAAGDRVYLNFGNNHFREASVHTDGTWSLAVSASDHQRYFSADGSYPIKIGSVDLAGNATPEISTHLIVDTQKPIPHISVDSVTRDNIINLAESGQNIDITGHVSGDFNVGDAVSLSVNGATISALTGVVDSQGNYSISVPAQTLIKANIHSIYASGQQPVHSIEATVITTDQAGNIGSATTGTQAFSIDKIASANIQLDPVTADNVINAAESNHNVSITGHVNGDVQQGDTVNILVGQQTHTGIVDQNGQFSIDVAGSELIAQTAITATVDTTDNAGNPAHASQTLSYAVDTQVDMPTITFENPGSDNAYSKAEIAQGHAGTITATVHAAADAKIGEHIKINGVDHVLDTHSLRNGLQIEVAPGSHVQVTMTDEHGNTAGSQGFAASAIPEPIVVKAPPGRHQISGTLGIPQLVSSLTPVPTTQSGWRIHLPNGQYVTRHQGQYGTLTIDPQTGDLHYQEQANVHTGPHGSASGIGQHEDKFEVALQGTNQDEVVAHVNVQILSHGPGHSGKLNIGTEVVDMTITPIAHSSHPAPPPPPPVQHDEPDMASQADFTVTQSDDSYLDLTQHAHQEPDQKSSHHGAAAYLDALGIKPDATSTTVHDQPADMDIVLAQVDQQDATTHDQAHLDMSDALEHHDANVNHNQDDEHHHHNDIDGLPDIDPNP
ncbi:VCBS domain-containing protein, partial [Vibrio sp. E150_011]